LAIFHGAIFDSCGIMRDVVISIMGTPAQQERNGIIAVPIALVAAAVTLKAKG